MTMSDPDAAPRIRRALLSVSDKSGLIEFAGALHRHGIELVSTGGTAVALNTAGIPVRDIAELTGFPEMMDGRLKTLHPKVHGGLLAIRGNAAHAKAAAAHGIEPIDMLVANLYPFEATVTRGAPFEDCVENIDVGGPAMIRAAAKNHTSVCVVVDPQDYAKVLADIAENGGASLGLRRALAAKAYARTAAYDAAIATWFAAQIGEGSPRWRTFAGSLVQTLRYGENPHQRAALYAFAGQRDGVTAAVQHQGKELSYNNLADSDAAVALIAEFDLQQSPAVAIIKHANPCGVALGATVAEAYSKALRCDPVSAFGGIIAVNAPIDAAAAVEITKILTEVVVAPDASPEARAIFAARPNLRLLTVGPLPDPRDEGLTFHQLSGGFLVQSRDNVVVDDLSLKVVSRRSPTPRELADMKFAFRVVKHVKSNAIVYAKDGASVGIGAGQMSRVDSARFGALKSLQAAKAAGLSEALCKGSVAASDAYFPFADGLIAAAEAGATAVIQPGGSVRDAEVIRAADERGIAMVFTGVRHFRH
jgi:phosphoribosylaminoimidazolecarboxamide formyltransferase/IMP cyclohydrolase